MTLTLIYYYLNKYITQSKSFLFLFLFHFNLTTECNSHDTNLITYKKNAKKSNTKKIKIDLQLYFL